jgi:uncharacterized protein DUF1579
MGWRSTLTGMVVVGAIGFGAGTVFSQDKGGQGPIPSKEDMQKMMDEMAKPTDEHKKLAALAGTWDVEMTMFEGAEPKKEKGVVTSTSILNGLYLASEHKSTMDGKPFEGRSIEGYSKEKKKYFAFWIDQMGTTPMLLWGGPDATGKKFTYDGEVYDCGPMGQMTPRMVMVREDADHLTFEFWAKMGSAPDFAKMMEGKYTRRK